MPDTTEPREKIIEIRALIAEPTVPASISRAQMKKLPPGTTIHVPYAKWTTITQAQMKRLPPGTILAVTRDTPYGRSTLYTCWRPPRHRDESPVAYYKRTKAVDDCFTHKHNGWYYCNPVHCKHRWRDKAERDAHLRGAYGALD